MTSGPLSGVRAAPYHRPMRTLARAACAAALATTLLAGALPAAAQAAPDPALLVDVAWPLAALDGAPVPAAAAIDATFAADGSLSGSAGCNRFMGSYTLDGDAIAVTPLATTRMACDAETMARENAFLDLLQAAATWTADGRSVTIVAASGGTLVFGELAAEVALVGTTWQLAALGMLPLPTDTAITATFFADGTASGNAGCNDWLAPYITEGAAGIAIGPVAATRKMCDARTMQQEDGFLTALEAATEWRIEDGALILSGGTIAQDLEFRATGSVTPEPGPADDFGTVTAERTWTVIGLAGAPVFSDDGLVLRFLADGSYDGNGGCNALMGTWTADGAVLALAAPAATKKACAEPVMALEADFLAFLPTVTGWSFADGELALEGPAGTLRLIAGEPTGEPTAGPAGTAAIAGPTWVLMELNGTPIPSALVRIGIVFAADGTLAGNGGCSDFTGTWSADATAMTVGIEGGDTAGCETSLKEFQDGMLLLLPLVDSWSVDADGQLHLDSSFGVQSTWAAEG